jgi:hypothetical protein
MSVAMLGGIAAAAALAPWILLYLYAKCCYSPREWLYIEWRTTHTCACIPCRYMTRADHDALWARVKSRRTMSVPVVSSTAGPTLGAVATTLGGGSDESEQCMICMSEAANFLVVPCGHQCGCEDCLTQVVRTTNRCPICRTSISRLQRVFAAGMASESPGVQMHPLGRSPEVPIVTGAPLQQEGYNERV